jgi:KDO2-lipid IV(A) lauroyltransferase
MTSVLIFFIKILSRLPLWFLYLVADFISLIVFRIFPYRKAVIDKNLESVFPEKSKKERKKIRNKFYSYLADLIVEGVKHLTISPENIEKRVNFTGLEAIENVIKDGRSVLYLTYHYSNWEWFLAGLNLMAKFPVNAMYQHMSNKGFEKLIYDSRIRFGGQMVLINNTYKFMNDNIGKNPLAIGLAADPAPSPEKGYWMEFLGKATGVFRGPENLARKYNMPVFIMDVKTVNQGHFNVNVIPITEYPQQEEPGWITEQYMKILERKIREKPETYLWSHRRWKHDVPSNLRENKISKNYPLPSDSKIEY